jgi:hypothetical protein
MSKKLKHWKVIVTIVLALTFLTAAAAWAGWSGKLNLSSSTDWSTKSSIVSAGGKVYVVWVDGFSIYFKWFNGTSWSANQKVNSGEYAITDNPSIAFASGKVHIVWEQYVNSQYEIYYRSFNQSLWSSITNVSQTSGYSKNPKVAAYLNNAYIVWEEDLNKDYTSDEIFYRQVSGNTWYSKKNLSASSGSESNEPAISVDGGKVRVTWTENVSGNREIFYRFLVP